MWTRVAPQPSELARPFWDGCNEGKLLLQRCLGCGTFIHHPEPECPRCGCAELTFDEVCGTGRIETFTVVHRSFVPGYQVVTPYAVGWIALPEQANLRIFSAIVGERAPAAIAIDAPVKVVFELVDGFGAVPLFELS
ncbi:Zn-ribbon domain-containing OB-fold protein [Rhodococcus opacus]|uniref:Zn-ribbon domain-containing OB-fold protein n=1 Tax=Rhodococcus opacus TaxID=37919 RepID=UPI001C43E412|nr:OB-fold domain-containing protein [Rhodococcus opacus]MBV6761733.1 OB-fold domain-containing protein [Rhodococcus opacus]